MGIGRFWSFGRSCAGKGLRRKDKKQVKARRPRRLQIEQFEVRQLLAASPVLQLVTISPYESSILGASVPSNSLIYGTGISNTVRTVAPTELVLDFNQGQNIDPSTLSAIQVFRSGGDHQFQTVFDATSNTYTSNPLNTAMDVPVPIGSATINQTLNTTSNQLSGNEVVLRFAQDLPADLYQVVIVGKTSSPLDGRAAALQIPLGATLAPTAASTSTDQPFNSGADQVIDFTLETGAHVTSVVPQPITRNANNTLSQARNEIDVYFDQQLNAASAQDPSLYQLIVTGNTANTTDDTVVATSHYTVQYSWSAMTGVSVSHLIFDADLSTYDSSLASRGGASAFRLRVGTQYYPFSTDAKTAVRSADETFVGADLNDLGKIQNATMPLGGETWVINGSIEPQTYALEWPGGTDTPGNRSLPNQPQVQYDNHFGPYGVADGSSAIPTFYYNFADKYNADDLTEHNEITDAQKQLIRDIFQVYASYLGVKFEEVYAAAPVAGEMTIATGDMTPVGYSSGGGTISGATVTAEGAGEAVMDGGVDWGNNPFGGAYYKAAMTAVSYLLGYAYGDETPQASILSGLADDPSVNLTQPENILLSPVDIATGQYMYRNDSSAIDLYRFELPTAGTLNLETIAQRMQSASTLNTDLVLYNSQHQVVARNDDYFGTDSYIAMASLPAGTYYLGVSASGNDNYNPELPLSGMGGGSQGDYELRISFAPSPASPASVLSDGNVSLDNSATVSVTFTAGTAPLAAGTDNGHPVINTSALAGTPISALDGKTFQVAKGSNTYTFEFVDSSNPSRQAAQGHLALSFNSQTDNLSSVLQDIAAGVNNAVSNLVDTTATPLDGDSDGIPGGQYNYWFNVQDTAHTLYVDKTAVASGANGSLAHPFTTIQAALAAAPGPAALQADGNITIDNSTIAFTFSPGTSPFTSGLDSGHPAILGINALNIPSMAALNHLAFALTRTNTGVTTTFEFVDVTVAGNAAAAGHQAIYYNSAADTPALLQASMTKAINGAVQPGEIVRIVGNNTANDNGGNTIVAVAANINSSSPLLQNGTKFNISDGQQTMTFEITRTGTVAAGNVPVLIKSTDTAQQVAVDIANAINSVNVATTKLANGLHAAALAQQDPSTSKWVVALSGPSVTLDLGALVQNDPLRNSLQDNVPYQIGVDPLGNVLSDGATLNVPKGTTLTVDAGAVIKLMAANIDVGSTAVNIDHSQGAIQVLGVPNESVYFTSWNDERVGSVYYANSQGPSAGDWGGLVIRNDFDYQEQAADLTRKLMEQQGIFVDYINHANIAYGGGQVKENGVKDYFDPIYLVEARPSITFNTITHSQHAGVSADPNSFQETIFRDEFGETPYTADYQRAGPSIYGNLITTSTYNGVFIRVSTAAGSSQQQLTTDARLSATDAVYVLAESLTIAGNPGGAVDNIYTPGAPAGLGNSATTSLTAAGDGLLSVPMDSVANPTLDPLQAGSAFSPGTLLTDRESFVLCDGISSVRFEFDYFNSHGASSGSVEIPIDPTYSASDTALAIAAAINSSGLRIAASVSIVSASQSANGAAYVKLSGRTVVVKGLSEVEGRLGGRLKIDPGAIIKASAARIETGVGAELLAEGTIDRPIIFTSLLDQAYGAGGTFDTANENGTANPKTVSPGDWSGLYFSPTSFGSMDYTRVFYAGGISAIEGTFAYFAPVEIRQAEVRITNSVFENNNTASTIAVGNDRNGRGDLPENAVIQIRGAQPVLVNDVIADNATAEAISIDCNSLNSFQVQDWGRSTGPANVFVQYADNVGPMIRQIKTSDNAINGMVVRGGTMLTEGVWDDTDIVHVLKSTIVIPNVTIYGGLKLESSSQESLVVKLLGANAEFLATGTAGDIQDRIGGSLQVLGTPAHPVVLTSLHDNTVGAGFDLWGNPQYDTENAVYNNIHDGTPITAAQPGDWNSLILDTYSNEYNAAEINEYEPAYGTTSDLNSTPQNAQYLGQLAQSITAGDDTLRLGFEVQGSISYNNTADKDVYSFKATAGTQIWLDIDRTTYALDSQIDLLDANGTVLATAYSSIDRATGNEIAPQYAATGQFAATMDPNLATLNGVTNSMGDPWFVNNMYSENPSDAGMRVSLPGPSGQQRTYYVRVSSHSGKSSGSYELQIRLQSTRITPGNVVRYATINYATNGVEVLGKPDHSPLEVQAYNDIAYTSPSQENFNNQTVLTQYWNQNRTQPVGNLLASDTNDLNVAGYLQNYTDVNWYSFSVDYTNQSGGSTIQDGGTTEFPVVFDIGYNSGLARTDAVLWIFDSAGTLILHGTGSQIVDQQVEPLQGANSGNLTHASYSTGDAYIGPVYLPTGSTYYVAITTLEATSKQQTDPLLRWEPIDSVSKIAEDNIGTQAASLMNALSSAPPFVLFPGTSATELNKAAVPFNLGDVPLYVLTAKDLYTADAYTGTEETEVDNAATGLPYSNSGPQVSYGDLTMRNDGRLYGITQSPDIGAPPAANGVNQSQWSGTSVQLDTGNASNAISTQVDGIKTFRVTTQGTTPALEEAGDDKNETGGVAVNAATYGPGNRNRNLYYVGDAMQDATDIPYNGGANYHLNNLLYVVSEDGVAHDPQGVTNDDTAARLPTNIVPMGQLQSGSAIQTVPATLQGADILDGTQFAVTDRAGTAVTFEFDSGPDMDLGKYGALGVRSGQQFILTDKSGLTKTFEFVGGPVLIFHNDVNGSLNQASFTVTDDKGTKDSTHSFEFVEGNTQAADGFTPITIPANATAQQVANAAIAAINAGTGDTKAALGEYGDASDAVNPRNGSTWARVSLIKDSTSTPPTSGNQGTGATNLIQVEGSYTPSNNKVIPIYFKETYSDPTFLAIETAAPTGTPPGLGWAADFGAQIQATVQANMPTITVGYSPAAVAGTVGGDTDMRINFYGAVNTGFTATGAGVASFGQASALVHDAATANADFNIRAIDVGAKYNGVVVKIVTGTALNVAYTTGTLTITVTATTTALQVVAAINAAAQANSATMPFIASLDGSQELGGTNNGSGIVKAKASAATTAGGFDNGIMTWTDATGNTPQVEDQYSPWGSVWTWRKGVDHLGDAGGLYGPLSGTGLQYQADTDYLVPFGAGDTALVIAKEMTAAVNAARAAGLTTVVATQYNAEVDFTGVSNTILPTAEKPLTVNGAGPGGDITGLAYESIDGTDYYFAVSDQGGVYMIKNINSPEYKAFPPPNYKAPEGVTVLNDLMPNAAGPSMVYLGAITDATGVNVKFEGLTAGPPDVENGAYSRMLFAVADDGTLYALAPEYLDTTPTIALAPIFLDGATSIATGLTGATGLAFTTLDYNLWHVTSNRGSSGTQTDPSKDRGHGVNADYDGTRVSTGLTLNGQKVAGGQSFYFGLEETSALPGSSNYHYTNAGLYNTYNLPDGAAGSLDTQSIDLSNYSVGDQPMLYFNYSLNMGGSATAKVFASVDGATWTDLSTQDPLTSTGTDPDNSWAQREYSLADFVGYSDVRLRFNFSTAGDFDVGDSSLTGSYLSGLSGEQLNDGDTFTLTDINDTQKTFEIDMGVAITVPNAAGDVLQNGTTFTVQTGTGTAQTALQTFEFTTQAVAAGGKLADGNIAVPFVFGETTAQVAQTIASAVNGVALVNSKGTSILADVSGNRVMLNGAEGVTSLNLQVPASAVGRGVAGQNFTLTVGAKSYIFQFTTGAAVPTGRTAINVLATDTASQIAADMALAINNAKTGLIAVANGSFVSLGGSVATFNAGTTAVTVSSPISTQGLQAIGADTASGTTQIMSGDSLSLTVNGVTTTFQFSTTSTVTNGVKPIVFTSTDTAEQVAADIASAINKANIGITAAASGTAVAFFGPAVTLSSTSTAITMLSNGSGVGAVTATGVTPNFLIPIKSTDSAQTVASEIAAAIGGAFSPQIQLKAVAGTAITDQSTFTVTNQAGTTTTFEFINSSDTTPPTPIPGAVVINYLTNDTAAKVATKIAAAMAGLTFTAAPVITRTTSTAGGVVLTGTGLVFNAGTSPITQSFAQAFTNVRGTLINTAGYTVDDSGILPYSDTLPGDSGNFTSNKRGQDNAHEGWYVDDVQIGFAGRGEMATTPATDNSAVKNNRDFVYPVAGPVMNGYYTLQIRRASDYGTFSNPTLTIDRTFDVNDRLSDNVSMTVPNANDISNGETFTISDGVHSLTFQYIAQGVNSSVTNPNYQPIYFTADESPSQIAAATAAAINLACSRGLTTVEATAGGGTNSAGGVKNGGLQLLASAGANIVDGSTFTITDYIQGTTTTFTFSTTATTATTGVILYATTDTAAQIAAKIAGAINAAHLTYAASVLGSTVSVTGSTLLFTGAASSLTELEGLQLKAVGAQSIRDQSIFSIMSYTGTVTTYGLTSSGAAVAGATMIQFLPTDTAAQVAAEIAAVVGGVVQGDIVFIAGTGLSFQSLTSPLVDVTPMGVLDEAGVHLFQATSLTTSWNAPTVPASTIRTRTAMSVRYTYEGDAWNVMDQGQTMIEENSIFNSKNYAIYVAGVQPTQAGNVNVNQPAPLGTDASSHPYSVGDMRAVNANRLVPGITIENNVLAYGGAGGILFSGDASTNGATQAAAPFGHIVNNTIYGGEKPVSTNIAPASFTKLTGVAGSATPATTTVYRIDLSTLGLATIDSLTITDNSAGLTGGPTGQYSGLDLDSIMISNTAAASAVAAASLSGLNVFNFSSGVVFVPGTQNAPVAPNLFGTRNGLLNDTVATLEAIDASGPTSAKPAGFVAIGVDGTITFNLTSPLTITPGTYLYIAVSDDKGQFGRATITAGSTVPVGTGILVQNNASPTILNNIVASLNTGIRVVAPAGDVSASTVVGYSVYQNNGTNNNLAANADTGAIYAASTDQLFVDAATRNFYPSQYSVAIDSSANQLDDRPDMVSVRQPLAIPSSPILAPDYDLFGQLRIADSQVSPYPGLGSNVYKDRGAIDRVDFVGATSALVTPQDNDAVGVDIDPRNTWVTTTQQQTQFAVQLTDSGSGIDDSTVTTANVVVTVDPDNNPADAKTLVDGTDYFFQYDSTNHIIHLIAGAGVWPEGYTYNIQLSTAIQDLAGNPLQPNRLDNTNQFTIVLAGANGSNNVPAAGVDFSHAAGEPVAWQIIPTTPNLYLGKNPPIAQAAYVASQTRADNDGVDTTKFTLAQGVATMVPVTVHNATTDTAYLNVWVDFYDSPSTAAIAAASETGNTATITTATAHGFSVGQQVKITGVGDSGYDGTFTINSVPTPTTFTFTDPITGLTVSSGGSVTHEGEFTDVGDQVATDIPVAPTAAVASATEAGSTVTITTSAAHGFSVGEQLLIAGIGVAGYNGTVTITSVPSATTFTYTSSATGLAASSGGTATVTAVPVTFTVPNGLNPTAPTSAFSTWMRVRLSSQQGLTSTGGMPVDATVAPATAEPDGEVEDFAVTILPPVTVTGTIWNDLNADGVHQASEAGLSGWTVYADIGHLGYYVATDPSTTTAADGSYTLTGVPPGSVAIGEVAPSGWAQTSPSPLSPTNGFATITATSGQTVAGVNFMDYQTTTITGTVWNDLTADGKHDSFEPGLGGWTVYVDIGKVGHYVAGDPSATTAADGTYTIANAPANIAISIGEVVQTNWVETSPSPLAPANGFITVTGTPGQTVSGENFLDNYTVPPAISAIALLDSNPTNQTTVHYSVTFTEPVTGVNAAAFALAATNLTGDSITGVTPTSSAVTFGGTTYYLTYTVTVAAGTVSKAANTATLGLNGVVDAAVIGTNSKSVKSTFTGPTYTIDRVSPLVSSIATTDATTTNAQSNTPVNTVHYAVTFSKLVTGLDANDLILAAPALAGDSIVSISPIGTAVNVNGQSYATSYSVTVNVGTGSGALGLNLAMTSVAADQIHDEAGNALSGSGSSTTNPDVGPVYTIDKVQPSAAITRAANQANPASTGPIVFTVLFSEPVSGFSAAGVDLSASTAAGAKVQSVTGSGTAWTVTVSGMSGNGSVVARVLAGAAKDTAGNLSLASSSSATVAFVSTPLVTISAATTQPTPTNRGPLVFTVTFNQPVVDFNPAKLLFTGSTAPGKLVATKVSGSGSTYTVSVTGMTATGLVKLSLPGGVAHNAAGVGNSASTGASNYVFYDIDPATEALSNPTSGSTLLDSTINSRGYIDVVYSAQTGVGLNTSTITDAGQEFTLSGAGAAGVVVNGVPTSMGGDVFRYYFTGKFTAGMVTVNFPAGTFQDNAGNFNKASSYSFTVARGVSVNNVTVVKPTSGTAKAVFTVTLSSLPTTTVTVKYTTANGTNTLAGRDYIATSGTLTFKPGMPLSQTVSISVIGNATAVTSTETFSLILSSPVGATLVAGQSTGTATIVGKTAATPSAALSPFGSTPVGPLPISSATLAAITKASMGPTYPNSQTSALDAVLATWYSKSSN